MATAGAADLTRRDAAASLCRLLAEGLSGVQCIWPAYRARGTKPR